jgi:hypothetical protein
MDSRGSVVVAPVAGDPMGLKVQFTVPYARQEDVVDRIARRLWNVEDYSTLSISFGPRRRRPKRNGQHPETGQP